MRESVREGGGDSGLCDEVSRRVWLGRVRLTAWLVWGETVVCGVSCQPCLRFGEGRTDASVVGS